MRVVPLPQVKVVPERIPLNGGLDLVTPPLAKKPGVCILAQNFEQAPDGGYRRIDGYERYDGRAKPSAATYTVLAATITGTVALADVVTGLTSAATGTVIALPGGSLVMAKTTGTFVSGESLQVSAVTVATSTAAPVLGGASTALLDATYLNLAADVYRALIGAIPGSGIVRGVIQFNDIVYGWRNNAGGTACAIYKSSGSGWTAVTLYNEVSFTVGGATAPAEGTTLTQGAVTATIKRVVATTASSTWASNTAAGRLIITNPAGGNFTGGAATIGGISVTLSAIQTAITLLPDGRYEMDVENFGGSVNTKRIYGCDGVNRGFEFDGDVFVPITTGMTTDAPTHVHAHLKQLFFSFGGSAQHAAPGAPYIWSAVLGAGELAMGDTISGFATQPGSQTTGTLAIFTRNRTSMLYGTGSASWVLAQYRQELGAYAHTIQNIGKSVFLDDRGVTDLQTAQEFGNFSHSVLSNMVRPRVNEFRTTAVSSCISRDLSQYRLFFSGGEALYMTIVGRRVVGTMQVLFPDVVRCVWSGEQNDGSEAIFFGSADGYVYQMNRGTSFDGDAIEYYFNLAYNNSGSPRAVKHYRHAMLEVEGAAYAAFSFGYSLGYGTTSIDQPQFQTTVTNFVSTLWDAFTWDSFTWDGQTLIPAEVDMGGDAENVSLVIHGESDTYQPFTVTGAVLHYTPRRIMR